MADDILTVDGQQPKYERHLRIRPRRSREVIAIASGKLCPRCGQIKLNLDFTVSKARADGLHWRCRACEKLASKKKYNANIETSRARARIWAEKHRREHPEAVAAAIHKFRTSDGGERTRAIARKGYYKDPQKALARRREWEKANPEKHAAEKLRWQKCRQERDPVWRMVRSIRRRVTGILSGQKNGRRTFDLLGYQPAELRAHVEALFTDGMSWDNYGEWHLDHDRPIASFDFDHDGAMRECWALANLKPMWKADNHAKAGIWNGVNYGKADTEARKAGWEKRRAKQAASIEAVVQQPSLFDM